MSELQPSHLRLAVADCMRQPNPEERRLSSIIDRLWRETPDDVARAYDCAVFGSLETITGEDRIGLRVERMRELHRPLPMRPKIGMRLKEIAADADMDVGTLTALMEHHGHLELAPYGRQQSRRLVTEQAFIAGLGHNVDPFHSRSPKLDGMSKASVFPVFYADRLPDLIWTLEWDSIQQSVAGITDKKRKLRWLQHNHAYLPVATIAKLTSYSRDGIEKALRRGITSKVQLTALTRPTGGDLFSAPSTQAFVGGAVDGLHLMPTPNPGSTTVSL